MGSDPHILFFIKEKLLVVWSLLKLGRFLKILHFSIGAKLMGNSEMEVTLMLFQFFPLFLIFSSNTNWITWISITVTVTVWFCYLSLVLQPVSVVPLVCSSFDTCVYTFCVLTNYLLSSRQITKKPFNRSFYFLFSFLPIDILRPVAVSLVNCFSIFKQK